MTQFTNMKSHLTGNSARPQCPKRYKAATMFPGISMPSADVPVLPSNQLTLFQAVKPRFNLSVFLKLVTLAVVSSR